MVGSVIQAIGMAELEDGQRIGTHSEAQSNPQRVCAVPKYKDIIILRSGVDQVALGANKSQIC